ncbi:MAG: competence/damage-inducible protein A [Anaerolineae bacterium]
MAVTTEIIAIGNELLIGDVQDTNTHWLCQRITGLGGMVLRASLIRDDPQAIGEVLQQAIQRGTQVIFTTGGLGPTADDLTLSALAVALGRPLEEHPDALHMVQETYARLAQAGYVAHPELTPERRKMAILPAGAQPLYNPVGAAPGVLLREGNTTIIALPGVPAELQGIFEQSLTPILRELYGQGYYAERVLIVDCGDESSLAPAVDAVQRNHPEVYVKSRAKAYGPGVRLKITLSARGDERAEVEGKLTQALEELQGRLQSLHIPIVQIS